MIMFSCIVIYILLGVLYVNGLIYVGVPKEKIRFSDYIFWIAHIIVIFFMCIEELAYCHFICSPHTYRWQDLVKEIIVAYHTDTLI
jgi:hypothetical protein